VSHRLIRFVALVVVAVGVAPLRAQGPQAPGGFVEPASNSIARPLISREEASSFVPVRGPFTFPAPYNTEAVRLTTDADCGGRDCVKAVGYSYWANINNHVGSDTMLIFLSLDRRYGGAGPSLFSVNKVSGETQNLGPLFPESSPYSWSSGEGWYFSHTRPDTLYINYGTRLMRYDVRTGSLETVFDIGTTFGSGRYVWQAHTSDDDRVHSATVRVTSTYEPLGCVVYREDTAQWYFAARIGDYDECQVDKSGQWLVIKENVDGRHHEDNRVIDIETGSERVLLDENGAGGHLDLGYGYMVAFDNFNLLPGAVRTWRFDMDLQGGQPVAAVSGQGTLNYHLTDWTAGGHVAHGNAKPDVDPERQTACTSNASRHTWARVNEIVCYRLDGSLETLVVAPTLTDLDAAGGGSLDYTKLPKGNLDVTGEYLIWTSNVGGGRLDAFLVHVPMHLLDTNPTPTPTPTWEPVRWTERVRAETSGNVLRKVSGCNGCADAGAVSEQEVTSGDLALQFTASETAASRVVGLSSDNTSTQIGEILFGVRLRNGIAEVRESGTYRKDVRFAPGDVFEVRVEGGVVRYVKNGRVFYTSTRAARYPLRVDSSLSSIGATVANARIRQGS
jgi:hypothetical protein